MIISGCPGVVDLQLVLDHSPASRLANSPFEDAPVIF